MHVVINQDPYQRAAVQSILDGSSPAHSSARRYGVDTRSRAYNVIPLSTKHCKPSGTEQSLVLSRLLISRTRSPHLVQGIVARGRSILGSLLRQKTFAVLLWTHYEPGMPFSDDAVIMSEDIVI